MKLGSDKRDEPEINLTSLIDVVFLLLIFFMVTTTFERQAALKVDLPEASEEPSLQESTALELTVSEEGRYFIDKNEVINADPETLREALKHASGGDFQRPVTLRADANARHQAVITAMDILGQLGFTNLSIATVSRESG